MEQSAQSIGPIFGRVFGTLLTAGSQRSAGRSVQSSAGADAVQYRQRAGEERAISQREAEENRLASVILQSRALAVASASGAGANDPTIINAIAKIAGRGDYAARSKLYKGESTARRYEYAADVREWEGKQSKKAGDINALSTIARGGLSLFDRYGGGGPSAAASNPQATTARDLEYDDWWTD